MKWFRKPGGSVHAFEHGIYTMCRRFIWQASWNLADPETSDQDRDDRCSSCAQLATASSHMSEATLIHAYGGLPIDS